MDDPSSSSPPADAVSGPVKSSEKLLSAGGSNGYGTSGGNAGNCSDDDRSSDADESDCSSCCMPATSSGSGKRNGGGCLQACLDRCRSACSSCGDGGCLLDCYWPRRYTVVLLQFIGMCFVHAQRVNMGVAVVSVLDAAHNIHSGESPSAAAANDDVRMRPFVIMPYDHAHLTVVVVVVGTPVKNND